MDGFEALERAGGEFERRLAAVGHDDLTRTTPCEQWSVLDLVRHVVRGSVMAARIVRGASRDEAMAVFTGGDVGDDLLGAFRAAAADQLAAFREPGALERITHHPAGDLPAAMVLGFRVSDLLVHAWDLARALGVDETLDPELVAMTWEQIGPVAPMLAASGMFGSGPSGALGPDAPLQQRLLDALGRRP